MPTYKIPIAAMSQNPQGHNFDFEDHCGINVEKVLANLDPHAEPCVPASVNEDVAATTIQRYFMKRPQYAAHRNLQIGIKNHVFAADAP